jgi:uncharacterized coiled-coil protein SlyX
MVNLVEEIETLKKRVGKLEIILNKTINIIEELNKSLQEHKLYGSPT